MKTKLLIIDPQNDFCDPKGSMFVPGADTDMRRVAELLRRAGSEIEHIQVTLDSHQLVDIAHPLAWQDPQGRSPDPFTTIHLSDIIDGVWVTRLPAWSDHVVNYVRELDRNGRYELTIWPPHCLMGTPGHNIFPPLMDALLEWQQQLGIVEFVFKGMNPKTEHYSVVRAEVVDPEDPTTAVNAAFIRSLEEADQMLVAGEALSHCVANSVRDIAAEAGEMHVHKLVCLTDAAHSVPGFEPIGASFLEEMNMRGMQLAKTTDYFSDGTRR